MRITSLRRAKRRTRRATRLVGHLGPQCRSARTRNRPERGQCRDQGQAAATGNDSIDLLGSDNRPPSLRGSSTPRMRTTITTRSSGPPGAHLRSKATLPRRCAAVNLGRSAPRGAAMTEQPAPGVTAEQIRVALRVAGRASGAARRRGRAQLALAAALHASLGRAQRPSTGRGHGIGLGSARRAGLVGRCHWQSA